MNRRAIFLCAFAALAFAALAFADAADSVNITHKGTAKFFSYAEGGPIGSNWATNLPPMCIPGGVPPEDAEARMTEDTRLALVGAFDAYFRRLMASVAFGTRECTNYVAGGYSPTTPHFIIDEPDDWRSDETISLIFGRSNKWYVAENRDYAVTNITITVTNCTGWTTNVLTRPDGRKYVAISNRYEVTQIEVPDTTRILARYRDGHNYLRGSENDNGIAYMVDWSYPPTEFDSDFYRWPKRRTINQPSIHEKYYFTEWTPEDFIGWGSSAAPAPDVSYDPYGFTSEWVTNLCEAVRHWGWFYPTTWDMFDAPLSRSAIWRGVFNIPNTEPFLGYDSQCPEDWEQLEALVMAGGYGGRAQYETNTWGVVTATNLMGTTGFEMLTNLVSIFLAGTNDVPLRTHMLPTEKTTYNRIVWPEWAGTDGFLALADMAIAGPKFLPKLAYDSYSTNALVHISYSSPDDGSGVVYIYGDYGENVWSISNQEIKVEYSGTTAEPGAGGNDYALMRAEGVNVADPMIVTYATGVPGAILDPVTETEAGVGINRAAESRVWMRETLLASLAYSGSIAVGDIVNLSWGFVEEPWAWDPRQVSAWRANGDVIYRYPNAWLDIYLTDVTAEGVCKVSSVTSDTRPRPYGYDLDSYMRTNSIPCTYPNPSYAGGRGDNLIEAVGEIKPTAISVIASTTNTDWMAADDAPIYGGNYDQDGYRFALAKPGGYSIDKAKDVDRFWTDTDDALKSKMVEFVAEANGIAPSRDPAVLAATARGKFDFDILPQSAGGRGSLTRIMNDALAEGTAQLSISTYCDPPAVRITRCDYNPDFDPEQQGTPWIIEYETVRQDTNGVWHATGEDVWRCFDVQFTFPGDTNTTLKAGGRYANGRITGVEAVRWDFDTMKRAKELQ